MIDKIEIVLSDLIDKTLGLSIMEKGKLLSLMLIEAKVGRISDDILAELQPCEDVIKLLSESLEGEDRHLEFIRDAVEKRKKYCESRKISRSFGKIKNAKKVTGPVIKYEEFGSVYLNAASKNKLVKFERLTTRIKKAIDDYVKRENNDPDKALEVFKTDCEKAKKSSFLTGNNPRKWKADILFILSEHGSDGIRAGKYDDGNPKYSNIDADKAMRLALERTYGRVLDDNELNGIL